MSLPNPTPADRTDRSLLIAGWTVAVAAVALCFVKDLRLVRVGDVLAGVSILTGFLFGTLVFVFQLRLRVTDDQYVPSFGRVRHFVDAAYRHLIAATGTALAATSVTVLADVTASNSASGDMSVSRWWTMSIALFGIRLLAILPLIVWDMRKAYTEIPG